MQKIIFTLLLIVSAMSISAQSEHPETVRLHLLHQGRMTGFCLKTHLNYDRPVRLAPQSYTVLEFNDAQLGIIQELNFSEQMIYLNFEKGKDYYFRISQAENAYPAIDEMSENAFKMELLLSDIDFHPTTHKFKTNTVLNN
ncbi:MAG: hypothetical protein IPJ74_14895 [Saprospiraceae bacterium]|nr:hypothetical protein [Saprospiraceae bacterium]